MARPAMFQRATVTRIVEESVDARTFVLRPHDDPITYQAGQFCTFRIAVDGRTLYRSYSMSSSPEHDTELMTTVKRVPGGAVSNWMHDNLAEGDEVELSRAAGRFCLREADTPLLGFSGGSGITPILSLTKTTLHTTARRVRLLCADRDAGSVMFEEALTDLARRFPGRLEVVRHLDSASGYLDEAAIRAFTGADGHGDAYVCGPEAFMDLVEKALPGPGAIYSERFGGPAVASTPTAGRTASAGTASVDTVAPPTVGSGATPVPTDPATVAITASDAPTDPAGSGQAAPTRTAAPAVPEAGTVTVILNRKKRTVPRKDGETLLESARRAGLTPPFSCEAGNCATCMAKVTDGHATLRVNEALSDDELADGYVLTCQAVPDTESITVDYE
ncbi:2Fe-2S iron-sulfur cluster-binding protein [Nocardia takedensis]|uniref:ferredoxin--NADP reductase n=1 Tax=Nocardia takedensis TaxID=259390 RepID=UPI000594FD82|nr:ferredoxin--NADP reductase [Nocardia takedensis]